MGYTHAILMPYSCHTNRGIRRNAVGLHHLFARGWAHSACPYLVTSLIYFFAAQMLSLAFEAISNDLEGCSSESCRVRGFAVRNLTVGKLTVRSLAVGNLAVHSLAVWTPSAFSRSGPRSLAVPRAKGHSELSRTRSSKWFANSRRLIWIPASGPSIHSDSFADQFTVRNQIIGPGRA